MFAYNELYDRNHRAMMFAWEHNSPKKVARWMAEEAEKARAYKHAVLYDGADLFYKVGVESDDDMSATD